MVDQKEAMDKLAEALKEASKTLVKEMFKDGGFIDLEMELQSQQNETVKVILAIAGPILKQVIGEAIKKI